jgi:prepilin-type N-terminal cleavage/methylation domain-containing protein
MNSKQPNGFTLIELILVMGLLVTVLALSAPRLASFFQGRNLDAEAKRFLALTRLGQSSAIAEGIPMVLWIDEQNGEYGLEPEPGYQEAGDELAGSRKVHRYQLADGLRLMIDEPFTALRGDLPQIRFLPEGFVDEQSVRRLLVEENDRDRLWVTLSRNRLNYEIRNHTNILDLAIR